MMTRYTSIASLTAVIFSVMVFTPASALEIAQAQETQPTQGQTDNKGTGAVISDQKIEAFAVAYLQVDKVRQEYSAKIEATSDAAAKKALETEGSKKMVEAVKASPSISVEEYSAILTAAQSDPAVAKKVQAELQKTVPAQQ
ncbi:DUF4168 domain-containing protein [Ensifer sesbaniae]|jgi:hypothetical protein|uniref:DUF4168 domain-containing protein n=1 Tax=Ensifer sesbaniae TaxID=1214071 RepID=UPI002000F43D|nr:DUF4168 domain-containing protein [Ensifer sesbaniae]